MTGSPQTNDQTIVALCSELSREHARVLLVSNDTNARTLAEMQGASTLDLKTVVEKLAPWPPIEQRLFWLCATPEYHYLFNTPQNFVTLSDNAWAYMHDTATRLLPDSDTDVAMACV